MTAPDFRPTHVVPQDGMSAWETPDPSRPTVPLDALLPVQLAERRGDWGRIVCANGWSAWVDGRLLVAVPQAPPAASSPLTRAADPRPLLTRVQESLARYRSATEDLTAGRLDGEAFRGRTHGLRAGVVVDGESVWLYDAEHERWVYSDGTRLSTYAAPGEPSAAAPEPARPPREATRVVEADAAPPPAAPASDGPAATGRAGQPGPAGPTGPPDDPGPAGPVRPATEAPAGPTRFTGGTASWQPTRRADEADADPILATGDPTRLVREPEAGEPTPLTADPAPDGGHEATPLVTEPDDAGEPTRLVGAAGPDGGHEPTRLVAEPEEVGEPTRLVGEAGPDGEFEATRLVAEPEAGEPTRLVRDPAPDGGHEPTRVVAEPEGAGEPTRLVRDPAPDGGHEPTRLVAEPEDAGEPTRLVGEAGPDGGHEPTRVVRRPGAVRGARRGDV
ncbi:hypothetical protein [Streptomyces sp. NPDC054842]